MGRAQANGVELEYEVIGDGEPVVMVMGLGAQLISWPREMREMLAHLGFMVIAFDNRDVGLSTKITDGSSYSLWDMADDTAGLLDALGLDRAHVVGASMGGMIAQSLAIRHPERVRSLTSIMSTTGDPSVGAPSQEALARLALPPAADRTSQIEQSIATSRVIWGDEAVFPFDEDMVRTRASAAYDRCFHPHGVVRQLMAIQVSGDRTPQLRELDVPTLVIHGDADPLVTYSGGQATAAAIPGAELLTITGMGHALPRGVWETVTEAIAKVAARAS